MPLDITWFKLEAPFMDTHRTIHTNSMLLGAALVVVGFDGLYRCEH